MPRDYAVEAVRYDATRGGEERAEAAAAAVAELLPGPGQLLDVGGGTGIVSARLAARGYQVFVADRVIEMLRYARPRLPGVVACMEAGRLAVADACVDVVSMVWLLHLVRDAQPLVAEAARVLRGGGHLVTTVDKAAADGFVRDAPADGRERVTRLARTYDLEPVGDTRFVGLGMRNRPVYTMVAFRRG